MFLVGGHQALHVCLHLLIRRDGEPLQVDAFHVHDAPRHLDTASCSGRSRFLYLRAALRSGSGHLPSELGRPSLTMATANRVPQVRHGFRYEDRVPARELTLR